MCGISGFLDSRGGSTAAELTAIAEQMASALAHRGPDDRGTWVDANAGIAFGHRRLSILDLSAEGRQPMTSACGRYVIVFNGEVYNFRELRADLEPSGHTFRGHSDTEVMLAAIREWGLRTAVDRFNGMFAFALWDREERSLSLVRDRLGIKPLYYSFFGGILLFGSELRALSAHPRFQATVDREALTLLLRHGYVPAPRTIYRGVAKLPPGTMLVARPGEGGPSVTPDAYWSARQIAALGRANPFCGSDEAATEELDHLLRDSVRSQMVSDVPYGAFLSGGVDSSIVVALMKAASSRPVHTFTIGFADPEFDESDHARAVAKHLGTDHVELRVEPRDALELIPRLPEIYDEPFADPSQIPTTLVAALTRKHVTVVLSGDGGDELFAGYERYAWATMLWRRFRGFPLAARKALGHALRSFPPKIGDRLGSWIPASRRIPRLGEKIHRGAALLELDSDDAVYRRIHSLWEPDGVVFDAREPREGMFWDDRLRDEEPDFLSRMQLVDLGTYLPDDILTKVDRATMASGLEARVPILDHRVVELAWRLPPSVKMRDRSSKWILRRVLDRYVPPELVDRPKRGFGVPIDRWLRSELRDWAESLLDERRLRNDGYFEAAVIRRMWDEHVRGARRCHDALWCVLMFQAWLEATTRSDSRL